MPVAYIVAFISSQQKIVQKMLPKVQKTKKLDTWVVGGRKNVQIMSVEGVE